jgi:hypothetical protein
LARLDKFYISQSNQGKKGRLVEILQGPVLSNCQALKLKVQMKGEDRKHGLLEALERV